VAPSEKEVAKIQVNSIQELRLALEMADRCVRFDRPGLAIPLLYSAMKYTVANVADSAIVAYVAESLASVIVLDELGDESLQSDDVAKPVPHHKSFLNSSLDLLDSTVESRRLLKSPVSPKQLARLRIAKQYFMGALEARRKAAWHYGSELIYLNLACIASLSGDKFIARDHFHDALRLVSELQKSVSPNSYSQTSLEQIWSPGLEANSFDDTAACMLIKTAINDGDFESSKTVETFLSDCSLLRHGTTKSRFELLPVMDTYATYDRGEDALRVLSAVPDRIPIPTTTLAKWC
jgi:hypothetical protein